MGDVVFELSFADQAITVLLARLSNLNVLFINLVDLSLYPLVVQVLVDFTIGVCLNFVFIILEARGVISSVFVENRYHVSFLI